MVLARPVRLSGKGKGERSLSDQGRICGYQLRVPAKTSLGRKKSEKKAPGQTIGVRGEGKMSRRVGQNDARKGRGKKGSGRSERDTLRAANRLVLNLRSLRSRRLRRYFNALKVIVVRKRISAVWAKG